MKNAKAIFFLLVLVLAAAVANLYLYVLGGAPSSAGRQSFVDLSADAAKIRLERRGEPVVALESHDGVWSLTEPFSGSADQRVVMRLLDAVTQASVVDVLSESELLSLGGSRTDFALEPAALVLELTDANGVQTVCSFGSPTPTSHGVYASVDGADAVFVIASNVLAAVDVSADRFRRRSLFTADIKSASSFSIRREGGSPCEFVRSETGWTMDGKTAAPSVAAFVSRLAAADAVDFVWPVGGSNESDRVSADILAGYGLDAESSVVVSLNSSNGTGGRVVFGKPVGGGLIYALVQNGGAIVTISADLGDFVRQDPIMFVDSRIFPENARNVSRFSIAAGGGLYTLSRGSDSVWRLESPVVAIADQTFAGEVLSRILALLPSDVVKEGGVSVSVGTNAVKVSVAQTGVLGSSTFENLRSREMLKVDPSLVRRLVSTPKGGKSSSVVYDRDLRQWNAETGDEKSKVVPKGVDRVLAALSPLMAVRVEKLNVSASDLDDYGLDAPQLVLAVDQNADEAVRRNILVGKKAKDGFYATIGSSDAVFVISEAIVENLSSLIVLP